MNRNIATRFSGIALLAGLLVCGTSCATAAASSIPGQQKPQPKKEEVLTNDSIIQMVSVGLDPEVIMLKIKRTQANFNLSSSELARLKNSGVSSDILKCMLDPESCAKPAPSAAPLAPATAQPRSDSPALTRSLPDLTPAMSEGEDYKEVGAYYVPEGRAPVRIDLRTLGQAKVGGRLGSVATLGIKSVKQKAYLLQPSAKLHVKEGYQPVFFIRILEGSSIDEYVLVQMDQKNDRRELEVGSGGGIVGAKQGLRFEQIRPWQPQEVSRGLYKAVPGAPLARGEYFIYIVGSADAMKGIMGKGYDFSID